MEYKKMIGIEEDNFVYSVADALDDAVLIESDY